MPALPNMMPRLPGRLRSRDGSRRNSSATSHPGPSSISSPFPAQPDEAVQLEALNSALTALIKIFPDVQPEVFREMLGTFPEESRLQVVIETLLKHKAKWVKGRWRIQGQPAKSDHVDGREQHLRVDALVPPREQFRSNAYKEAVKLALYQEFKGLSHSAIKAVLAEQNYSYLDTRREMLLLASKSWRYSFTAFLSRKKPVSEQDPPFISWRPSRQGRIEPLLSPTHCKELDAELESTIIMPWRTKQNKVQEVEDRTLAERLNEEEANEAGTTYDCNCCFSSYSFERIVPCAAATHYICFDCVRRSMSEALFGQTWAQCIEPERVTLRCFAMGSRGECNSYLPRVLVQQALASGTEQDKLWAKFEERSSRDNVATAHEQSTASQCPCCMYAEVYDLPMTMTTTTNALTSLSVLSQSMIIILAHLLRLIVSCCTMLVGKYGPQLVSTQQKKSSFDHPTQGQKFICRNPNCSRASCLRCLAPWIDIHSCHASSRQALQTYIESSVSDAIKRTCPKCNLSFIKASGCNKLVCVCGYSMCYVCRQDVGKEGYSHFCPHFRPEVGQTCRECERCDLYRTEDEDMVIEKAKEKAVMDWKERMQGEQGVEELLKSLEDEGSREEAAKGKKKSWLAEVLR